MTSFSQGTAKQPAGRSWKRRYPRHRVDFPVLVTMLGENGYEEVSGRCSDIGEGGLGTLLVSELTPGEVVAATIQPRVAPPLTVRCVVRYRKGLVHGLEFLGLTAEQLQIVRQLCAGAAEID